MRLLSIVGLTTAKSWRVKSWSVRWSAVTGAPTAEVRGSRSRRLFVVATVWVMGAGCMAQGARAGRSPETSQHAAEPVEWADLKGWSGDDHTAAFATFLMSCKPLLNNGRSRDLDSFTRVSSRLRRAVVTKIASAVEARNFFEENFRPVRIASLGKSTGLLTGYCRPDRRRFALSEP